MTEPDPPESSPEAAAPGAQGQHPDQQVHGHEPHAHEPLGHGLLYALLAVFVLALAFGGWGAWTVFARAPANPAATMHNQQRQLDEFQQRVTTLSRSDQISREANRDLQGTLAERDEEIAGLRADVAFYERFVGATAKRRGLSVHELQLQAQGDQAWHFTATLTQNLNRGAVNSGRLTLLVEGTRAGKLQQLDWGDLRQQPKAAGVEYSFKYFQEVEGDLVLPPGLKPVRVKVRLQPASGAAVEQSFAWAEAVQAVPTAAPDDADP